MARPIVSVYGPPVYFNVALEPVIVQSIDPVEFELGFDDEGRPRILFRVDYMGHFEQIVVVFTNGQNITQGLFFNEQ